MQAETIPAVLAGRDVLGVAPTGTGKTAAFALPILSRLRSEPRNGPYALVVVPTRELAQQIQAEIALLGSYTKLTATTIFGGVAEGAQIRALRNKPDIVIACPGRLLDLWRRGAVKLDAVRVLVLDEADHMFDMGFLPDVRKILSALPRKRQNLLFSATMPREIRALADHVLHEPHVIEIGRSAPAETIEHALCSVSEDRKVDLLAHLIDQEGFSSTIVFLRTKRRAKRLADRLTRMGHSAVSLQGNMSQSQRERAMQGFRAGRFDVLVATDIAARGLDVAQVSHVVNFDVPSTPTAYTHRIGRTGRSERRGKAYTFVTGQDREAVRAIERELGQPIARADLQGFVDRPERTDAPRHDAPRHDAPRRNAAHRSAPHGQAAHGQASRSDAPRSENSQPARRRRRFRGARSSRRRGNGPRQGMTRAS